ncbi:MAG: hypothetical protein H0T79_18120, partial [Deltaproteobacteria bacterium]|nr:hypothetical protein [Deltaproteobacteria bacterium]
MPSTPGRTGNSGIGWPRSAIRESERHEGAIAVEDAGQGVGGRMRWQRRRLVRLVRIDPLVAELVDLVDRQRGARDQGGEV